MSDSLNSGESSPDQLQSVIAAGGNFPILICLFLPLGFISK